jgi:hypothetical protein
VWRTALGRVLLAWMGLITLLLLAYGRLLEVLSLDAYSWGFTAAFLAAPVAFLHWCAWELVRRPRLMWPALLALVLFCASVVAGIEWVGRPGAYLNLLAHRAEYDRIVADAKAGRLPGLNSKDWVEGTQNGTRYVLTGADPGGVIFPWDHRPYGGWTGVIYDEEDCPPRPPSPPSPPPPPHTGPGDPPVMKNAGRLDSRFHLSGHYCFTSFGGM